LDEKLDAEDEFTLEYMESDGDVIKTYTNKKDKKNPGRRGPASRGPGASAGPVAETKQGMNSFVWNMRYPDAKKVPNAVMWGGSHIGPKAVPGEYKVRLTVNGNAQTESFFIIKDPRIKTTQADFRAQFNLLMDIRDRTTEINEKILTMRSIKKQINTLTSLMDKSGFKNVELIRAGKALTKKLSAIEEELIQVKSKSGQDPLNYPIKLDNKIAALVGVVSSVDARPTAQSYSVLEELVSQAQTHYKKMDKVLTEDLFQFNNMVSDAAVPAVMIIPSEMSKEK
jgi:hypothetical protein